MTGSTNYRSSTLKDHAQTDGHKRAVGEEAHAEVEASGVSLQPRKVYQGVPSSSSIVQELNRIKRISYKVESYVVHCVIWYHLYNLNNVKNTHGEVLILVKFQASHIVFCVATKELPLKYFKDDIELQKFHNVKF